MSRKWLTGIGLVVLGSASLHAIDFRDIDDPEIKLSKDGGTSTYKGTFDILNGDGDVNIVIGSPYNAGTFSDIAGYDPLVHDITEATAFFYLRDDSTSDGEEKVEIKFKKDSGDSSMGTFASGTILNKSFSVFSDAVSGSVLAAIEDGVLRYEVKATKGDFYLDFARLDVTATLLSVPPSGDPAQAVPDTGSTLALMGMALAGVAVGAVRQRR